MKRLISGLGMRNQDKRWHTDAALWEKLKLIAREMRGKPTEAENLLWQRLRRHQLFGLSFRRQHSIDKFIVDFYCAKARLVIEVDGEIHRYQREEDSMRKEYLESLNLKVLRFSNDTVLKKVDEVIKQISSYLPHPHQFPLSASGERVRKRGLKGGMKGRIS